MFIYRFSHHILFCALATALAVNANAVVIDFQGDLDVIALDSGGAIYSGVPGGTLFSGSIDVQADGSFTNGSITGGGITTSFSCCSLAAESDFSNNVALDQESADLLNLLSGTSDFNAGDRIDGVNIEGDANSSADNRIEVGLSYIFPESTFADGLNTFEDIFPQFNPDDAIVALFFILEEDDSQDEDIYSGLGQLNPVPLPAAAWLFGSALVGLVAVRKRR